MNSKIQVQPMDMLKVRIQLNSESGKSRNPAEVAKTILQERGIKGFYAGIDSALLRQAVYATMRLGIYFNLTEFLKSKKYQNIDNVNLSM